jgi:uncharacterized protein (TIGR00730 family)
MKSKTVVIFGSSRPREGDPEYERARELGRLLAESGFVICNGGYAGTMEASAKGAKEAGGRSIGIVSEVFSRIANPFIDQTVCVRTFQERLFGLIERGDAYVILKGGTGTLVELAMVWELMNKRMMREKPVVVLDFWRGVVDTLTEELIWEGLGSCTRYVSVVQTPNQCVEVLIGKMSVVE